MEKQDELRFACDLTVLLERVFLRIGSAETDEQLEQVLGKFLAPVLLKLSSEVEGVRKKVMEFLVHVNKRFKSRPTVQLPVEALLEQYRDPSISPFVTNFSILYIKMGFPRLSSEKQTELIPLLMQSVSGRPEPQQNSLLQLIIPALQHLKFPKSLQKKYELIGLNPVEDKTTTAIFLDFMLDMLLLPYNFASFTARPKTAQTVPPPFAANTPNRAASATPPAPSPPPPAATSGLSEAAFKRAIGVGETPLKPEDLEKVKLGILEVLGAEIFAEQDILCHLVVGTSDTRYLVVSAADRELKRIAGNQDWNNPVVVAKLFSIFQGTVILKGQNSKIKEDQKRVPAGGLLRAKIFPFLLKSKTAANQFPACVQVVFDCLYREQTNAKLKSMAIQFVHHIIFYCEDTKFRPLGAVLLSGMVKFIKEAKEESKLRSMAYVAIGKIASRLPDLVKKDIGLLQTFFDAVSMEDGENRLAVQEALSMMRNAFQGLDPAQMKLMEALVLENIEKEQAQARRIAVQYAIAVFPADHLASRYALLLACSDNKEETANEAKKALKPYASKEDGKEKEADKRLMPSFGDMVAYIQQRSDERVKTQQKYVTGSHILAFNPKTFAQVLLYLRNCLAYEAGIESPNASSISDLYEEAPKIALHLRSNYKSTSKGPLASYIRMIRQVLTALGSEESMMCLLEIVSVARDSLAKHFQPHLPWIKNFMFHSRDEIRSSAAQLYATVTYFEATDESRTTALLGLLENLKNGVLESQHGSLVCCGYLIGLMLTGDLNDANKENIIQALKDSVEFLDSSQALLSVGASSAIAEMARRGPLPLPDDTESGLSKRSLVEKLIKKLQSSKESNKVREKAAVCLGNLCVGDKKFPFTDKVISGLMDAAAAKQMELHVTIGECLVSAALGPKSSLNRDFWTTSEADFKAPDDCEDRVAHLLELLLTKYTRSANHHIRQAACIWLVALVQNCGSHPSVNSQLMQAQSSFMAMLSENDEITQDVASKGLGIVYESCSAEQKKELVSVLVDTLTTGKRHKQQEVTGETQLFQEGALGKTPDGQGMSTYKELCSIASDLNQPDLIYKFMHLANHNATWNSKKGAAFGFSTIAAQAGEQLAPYLHQILPKLYRYQFDPNPRIQTAMSSIWDALVKDNKKTVDKYLKPIAEDLIRNLTNNQWRVRESSCMAVCELLRGRTVDDLVPYLPELWETMFRVRDDIKESVRNAADLAIKALSKTSIKLCDASQGSVGEAATSQVLPCLLKAGLGSQVQECRAIALATIVKISKTAGKLLKPHIPLLVTALLEALSTLEPQYLNYLSLHATMSSEETQDKLDTARLSASKTSPMMETVSLCVQFVDDSVLPKLIPSLTDLVRSGVGLGTKAGCASFIISIVGQCPKDITPYAGKILGALLNGLNDRNPTVRKSYASAIGYVVKVAKDSSVEKLLNKLKGWYLEKEDNSSVRAACGITVHAINQRSPDVLRRHGALVLPLAYLAMHETKAPESTEKDSSVWEEVWLDATPGTEAGLRLYMTEVVALAQTALDSQSWPMKAQGAATLSAVASKMQSQLGPPSLGVVLKALVTGLNGRIWDGKEELLKAVATVCTSCKNELLVARDGQPNVEQEVVGVVLKESQKERIAYRMEALTCLSAVLECYEVDHFSDVAAILYPTIEEMKEKNSKQQASDHDVTHDLWLKYLQCVFDSLGQVWPHSADSQAEHGQKYCEYLCQSLTMSTWKVDTAALRSLKAFMKKSVILKEDKLKEMDTATVQPLLSPMVQPICKCLGNLKYSAVRSEALELTNLMVSRLTSANVLDILGHNQISALKVALETVSKENQMDLSDTASDILKSINTFCN